MGGKSSHYQQADRPESGGANHDMQKEKSGLLDREQAKFAEEQVEKQADAPEQASEAHEPFSVGKPRNPEK